MAPLCQIIAPPAQGRMLADPYNGLQIRWALHVRKKRVSQRDLPQIAAPIRMVVFPGIEYAFGSYVNIMTLPHRCTIAVHDFVTQFVCVIVRVET